MGNRFDLGTARNEATVAGVIIAVGAVARVAVLAMAGIAPMRPGHIGEAANIALSFARNGTFADTYGYGSGPSVHVSPVMPTLTGSIFRLFGGDTPAAELALALVAIALVLATAAALYRAAVLLKVPVAARLAGLAGLCLVPLNMNLEVTSFRVWEGALAACLSAILLWRTIALSAAPDIRLRDVTVHGLLLGLMALISPPLGLCALINAAILLWQVRPMPRRLLFASVGAASCALVLLPWTIRNAVEFHKLIPVRGNAGLEMRLAYNDLALQTDDQRRVYQGALATLHPSGNPPVFAALERAGGEIAYADQLGRDAREWVLAHPGKALALTLDHWRNFYFPAGWIYAQTEAPSNPVSMRKRIRAAIVWPVSAAGLLAILLLAIRRRGGFVFPAVLVVVASLPYALVHPNIRYSYILYAPLMFAACAGAACVLLEIARRVRPDLVAGRSMIRTK